MEPLKLDNFNFSADSLEAFPQKLNRYLNSEMGADPFAELPIAQARLVRTLIPGALSGTCISEELGLSISAVMQVAQKLIDSGWLFKETDESDHRVKVFSLTEFAKEVIEARRIHRLNRAKKLLNKVTQNERDEIVNLFNIILDALEKPGSVSTSQLSGEILEIH